MDSFEREMCRKMKAGVFERIADRPRGFYYEVHIDFNEHFDEIWEAIKGMPYDDAVTYCLQYMDKREAFYNSPHYVEMLDRLVPVNPA